MQCSADDCDKPAAVLKSGKPRHGGLCYGHARRKTNGQPLTELRPKNLHPLKRLEVAALEVRDANTDDDEAHKRALKRLYMAAVRLKKHKVQKRTEHPP
jgi:hypothetical protein